MSSSVARANAVADCRIWLGRVRFHRRVSAASRQRLQPPPASLACLHRTEMARIAWPSAEPDSVALCRTQRCPPLRSDSVRLVRSFRTWVYQPRVTEPTNLSGLRPGTTIVRSPSIVTDRKLQHGRSPPYEATTATASISIMKSGPARRVTPTVVLVGVATPK